jgi:hypothetical protein
MIDKLLLRERDVSEPLRVSSDDRRSTIRVGYDQLNNVTGLLTKHRIPIFVEHEHRTFAIVELGITVDPAHVQSLLDAVD